jgi:hypothetical protein
MAECTADVAGSSGGACRGDQVSVDTGMFGDPLVAEQAASTAAQADSAPLPARSAGARRWRAARALAIVAIAIAVMVLPGWQVLRAPGETIELPPAAEAPLQGTMIAPLATGVTLSASIPVAPVTPAKPDRSKPIEPALDERGSADDPRPRRPTVNIDRRPRKRPVSTTRRWDPDSALPP